MQRDLHRELTTSIGVKTTGDGLDRCSVIFIEGDGLAGCGMIFAKGDDLDRAA